MSEATTATHCPDERRTTVDRGPALLQRLVVFTGDLSYSVRAGIVEIDRAIDGATWLVVVHVPKKGISTLARNQWRNYQRNGWRWIPYQLTDLLRRVASRHRGASRSSAAPGAEARLDQFTTRSNMRIERVEDLHAQGTLAMVRAFEPDLGLSLAAPILRRRLFSIPRLGTLNLHKGKLPQYRGMPPAFWELWNEELEVGCTIHEVDDGLDTGRVVCVAATAREPYSDVSGLQLRLEVLGIELMRRAVVETRNGRITPIAQSTSGEPYRKPSLGQIKVLERRLASREPNVRFGLRGIAKEAVFAGSLFAWKAGGRLILRPRIVVLLYHRVSDDARDNLTVGIGQFDRQMAMLQHHCRVLSLDEVIAADHIQSSDRPLVCVTFDDGYLDNHANAAPILRRHGVPAAFFVSTGIVGTNQPFAHDVRRNNARPPAMTWEQVQKLHEEGFTIGSHSVNHIDCGSEPERVVRHELAQSFSDLRQRLGLERIYFAYPYGGRQHMTRERLALVKETGYAACLSAYGGVNVGHVDRFNILRAAIHWETSDRAFRFKCLGIV